MIDSGTISLLSQKFTIGILIFVRIAAVLSTAPMFAHSSVQPIHKIGLAAITAISFTSIFWKEQPAVTLDTLSLAILVVKEFMVGAAIGFASSMIMTAARFAGGMLDYEVGFQTALLFDQNAETPTLIGELKSMAALMIFLGMNGHHFVLEALVASFRIVPLDTFFATGSAVEVVIRLISMTTIVAVKIAAPALTALLAVNISLALLSRVAPQLNIFALSMQFKVAVGLIVLFLTAPLFAMLVKNSMVAFQQETYRVLMALNPTTVVQ